jgi:predicted dehydrogenase
MADKLRCAVIGAGGIGLDHLHSLVTCHRAAAVAIAETNPQRAREACARNNVPRSYVDYRELLEQPDIDAVIIALPTYLHAPVAIEALKARKHVLIEKPMAMNAKEAAKVVETAKQMKRTLMVAQNFRFNKHTQLARSIVERGDLGEIYHARGFWLRRAGIPRIGSWFTRKQFSGGGAFADIGIHLLDACLHLMKEFDVATVTCRTHAKFGPRGLGEMDWGRSEVDPKKPFDVEDYGVALLRLKSGRTVLLEIGWACFQNNESREYGVDLLGTNAGMALWPARLYRNMLDGHETLAFHPNKVPFTEDRVHHFVGCVLDGKKPIVPPEESLKVQQALDALYASADSGKEVKLG